MSSPQRILVRFIPACAGNRHLAAFNNSVSAVHPRVCGEQTSPVTRSRSCGGSSPRVRGTAHYHQCRDREIRFIPACAGNSPRCSNSEARVTVHPRVCGEQVSFLRNFLLAFGSSPRVRGTAIHYARFGAIKRFIPACAGNRPRLDPLFFFTIGSSPRVRGTGSASKRLHPDDRFIPACAGNRGPDVGVGLFRTVHPRVCGEQARRAFSGGRSNGSSPRVRGTAEPAGGVHLHLRFIPACAGNRDPGRTFSCPWSVHPRVCGEQIGLRISAHVTIGSSPRVRGTADYPCRWVYWQRFIPACAGNRITV